MFVYMSRSERRALQELIRSQFGDHDLPRGSRETFLDAIGYLEGCIDWAHCCCDSPCECEGSTEAELALADQFVNHLRGAHPRWRLPRRLRRSAPVHITVEEPIPAPSPSWQVAPRSPDMERAIAAATAAASAGEVDKVLAALATVGSERVSAISEGDIPAFLAALAS